MRLNRAMIVAVLLGATASSSSAQITSTDNSVHPGSQPAVSLSLSAVPARVKVGESIRLYISLKNISTKEIFVGNDIGSAAPDYDVFVVDDQGAVPPTTPYYRFVKGGRLPSDPRFYSTYSRSTVLVQPGKALGSSIDLGKLYELDHAGLYKIWVERLDQISNTKVKSNTISVTISQ